MRLTFTNIIRALLTTLYITAINVYASVESVRQHSTGNPVVLISIDGFRYDYLDKYHAPSLRAIAKQGIRAERMLPSYPSSTFPNHLSIITGMYPARHGVVHNTFYDRKLNDVYTMGKAKQQPLWLQGTPLWTLAEQHGLRAATYFWPESDAKLRGILPSYYFPYDKSTPYQQRIDQIIDWLKLPADKRPSLITGYFSIVDSMGHEFGPNSPQVANAVSQVDRYIGILKKRLDSELNIAVNLVVLSDHGMVETHSKDKIHWKTLHEFTGFKVINGRSQLMLYAMETIGTKALEQLAASLNQRANGRFKAYTKQQLPKNLRYFGNERIADIIVEAIPPVSFSDYKIVKHATTGGHGYNPHTVTEMGALFIANGPDFHSNRVIPAFANVHVFSALVEILGLPMPNNTDSNKEVLAPILKKR